MLLNGTAAKEHVPGIEWLIRMVKEIDRAKINTLMTLKIQSMLQSIL